MSQFPVLLHCFVFKINLSANAACAKIPFILVRINPLFSQFYRALGAEIEPIVDQARIGLLGVYEHYLRPYIGKALDDGITAAQPVLDAIMPAE